MNTNRFYATMAIPVLLFLLSYFQGRSFESNSSATASTSISEESSYLEVPDYIFSAEYRMIVEKIYLDLYGPKIPDSLNSQSLAWLGYCGEGNESGTCNTTSASVKRCGDKIKLGEKIFCIPW